MSFKENAKNKLSAVKLSDVFNSHSGKMAVLEVAVAVTLGVAAFTATVPASAALAGFFASTYINMASNNILRWRQHRAVKKSNPGL